MQRRKAEQVNGRAGQDAPPTVYGAGGGRGKTEPYTQKHEQCEKCKNNFANVILSLPFFYPSALPPFHSSPLTASV